MQKGKRYAIGVLMVIFGGSGLAEISTSNHGCFWFCAITFSIGIGLCMAGFEK